MICNDGFHVFCREERHLRYQQDKLERERSKEEARKAKLRAEQEAKDREAAHKR